MTHARSAGSPPLPVLPPRAPDSHKGDFGRGLLIGGSIGMTGAISLAGYAALRSGAGLVQLAVPAPCLSTVAQFEPSYMTAPLPSDDDGRICITARHKLAALAEPATAVACGPGLGRSPSLTDLVGWLYTTLTQPAVFDADALNALADRSERLLNPGGPRVLTPHPGEFRRLSGVDRSAGREELEQLACDLAGRWRAVIVLKGHRTLITDGHRKAHNATGNPGMATGGTGDVLTGVITALLCQGLAAFEAAQLGAYLHGLAGDLAAAEFGQVSLIARDLVNQLPAALLKYQREHHAK
jgi:hydroxyethylthiazole kinase-like uncharacterized protein yjeF